MKRGIVVGLFLTALVAPLAGCGGSAADTASGASPNAGGQATSKSSPAAKPEDVLKGAAAKLTGKSVRFTVDDGTDSSSGIYDAASGASKLTATVDGSKMDVIGKGNDVYIGGLDPSGKWMKADATKFTGSGVSFLTTADPLFAVKYLATAANVKQDQPSAYSGTIDLSKVTGTDTAKRIAGAFAKSAGSSATALPFTATLDATGGLATLTVTFPKADLGGKDFKYDLKVLSVGGAETVTVPAKNTTTEAPSDLYKGP